MSNTIDNSIKHRNLGSPAATSDSKTGNASKAHEGTQRQADDSVFLTNDAETLKRMESSIKEHPVVNQEKVAEIKRQIAEGAYVIDAEKIAESFIGIEKALN